MKRKLIFYFFTCIFAGVSAVAAETVMLDRQKTVQMALERNEMFKSARLEKDRVLSSDIEALAKAIRVGRFDDFRGL